MENECRRADGKTWATKGALTSEYDLCIPVMHECVESRVAQLVSLVHKVCL